MHSSVILDQAKESLGETEVKLLTMMLQMRGSYSLSQGKPMASKQTQTYDAPLIGSKPRQASYCEK